MNTPTLITELTILDAPAAPAPKVQPAPASPLALPLPPTVVAHPLCRGWVNLRLVGAALGRLRGPLRQAAYIVRRTIELNRAFFGRPPRKVAHVAGRHYREYHVPGWPGAAHRQYLDATIARLAGTARPVHTVFLAVTKKCPLACEHCLEGERLNQPETLTQADLHELVARFQAQQASQVYFMGGEPMLRVPDLVAVLEQARPGTDFWVITSGFNFTAANAQRLRAAGLTGVVVSLDHHETAAHDGFRGRAGAYEQALQAVAHAHVAGLVVSLSLCATRAFTTAANLWAYARLARQLGVAFIKVLEPRAVGHYAGQDVALTPAQIALLEQFQEQLAHDPAYRDWPIVFYYAYHQRRVGCGAVGNWFLYVDSKGDLHACPFCQRRGISALGADFGHALANVRAGSCPAFAKVEW